MPTNTEILDREINRDGQFTCSRCKGDMTIPTNIDFLDQLEFCGCVCDRDHSGAIQARPSLKGYKLDDPYENYVATKYDKNNIETTNSYKSGQKNL